MTNEDHFKDRLRAATPLCDAMSKALLLKKFFKDTQPGNASPLAVDR
jgi:hypothetical protein